MAKKDSYRKTDLREIHALFNDQEKYDTLCHIFYSGSTSKKILMEAANIRKSILDEINILMTQKSPVTSQRLTELLESFKNNSSTLQQGKSIEETNLSKITKSLKQTLLVSDKLEEIFNYNGIVNEGKKRDTKGEELKWAPVLIKQHGNSLLFQEFTAFRALARQSLYGDKVTLKDHELSAIAAVTDKGKITFSIPEIYDELKERYDKITKLDYVISADKTNYLKETGMHGKNYLSSTGIAMGLFAATFAINLMNAPLAGGTLAAWGIFMGVQAGLFTIFTAGGMAGGVISQKIRNHNFSKLRERITQISDKKQLFDLVIKNNTRVSLIQKIFKRKKYAGIKMKGFGKCGKEFTEEAEKLGILDHDLAKKLAKGKNFKTLLDVSRKTPTFGATRSQIKKMRRLDKDTSPKKFLKKKELEDLIVNLGDNISDKNPIAEILSIPVKKNSAKTGKSATILDPIPTQERTPIAAKNEQTKEEDFIEQINKDKDRIKEAALIISEEIKILSSRKEDKSSKFEVDLGDKKIYSVQLAKDTAKKKFLESAKDALETLLVTEKAIEETLKNMAKRNIEEKEQSFGNIDVKYTSKK